MVHILEKEKPKLFRNDTTFGEFLKLKKNCIVLLKGAFTSKCVVATITFNVQLRPYYQVLTFVIVQAHRKKYTSSTYQFTIARLLICGRF